MTEPANIRKLEYTEGNKTKTISFEDILKCTTGGQGIGAKFVRNLNRLMLFREHGWVDKRKVQSWDQLGEIKQLTHDNLQKIQENTGKKVHNYKELKADAKTARKLAELSKLLLPDLVNETKATASRLEALRSLKKVDPRILVRASLMRPEQKSDLITHFFDFSRNIPLQDLKDLQTTYDNFLASISGQEGLQNSYKDLQNEIKGLGNSLARQELGFEEPNPKMEEVSSLSDKELIRTFWIENPWVKNIGTTESVIEDMEKEGKLETPEKFNDQFYRDYTRRFQQISIENHQIKRHQLPNLLQLDEKQNTKWESYISQEIKDYLGNDEKKLKKLALLITQGSSDPGRGAVSQIDQTAQHHSFQLQIEKRDGNTYAHITDIYGGLELPDKAWQTTLSVNLDSNDAPAQLKLSELSMSSYLESILTDDFSTFFLHKLKPLETVDQIKSAFDLFFKESPNYKRPKEELIELNRLFTKKELIESINQKVFGDVIGTTQSILVPEDKKMQPPSEEELNFQFNREIIRLANFKIEGDQIPFNYKKIDGGWGQIPWQSSMPGKIKEHLGKDENKIRSLAVLSLVNTLLITSLKPMLKKRLEKPNLFPSNGTPKFHLYQQDGKNILQVEETYYLKDSINSKEDEWWNTTLTYNLDDLNAPVYLKTEPISKNEFDALEKEYNLLLKTARNKGASGVV